jgi:trehalose-6-phosphatase
MRPLRNAPQGQFSKVKYVLTDVDDTLTYRGKLSARTYDALERLQTAKIKVIPVTAAPAGWCDLMVRMWPIDGVIGENGGFYTIRRAQSVERKFWTDDHEQAQVAEQLQKLWREIELVLPLATLAADHVFRLTSVAWDRPSSEDDTNLLYKSILDLKANATINSLWVLGWYGSYDKLAMARRMMSEVYGVDIDNARDEILYVGDSTNDAPMFSHFPNSVGVRTVVEFLPKLAKPPAWVTQGHGGDGLVEVADSVIANAQQVRGGS